MDGEGDDAGLRSAEVLNNEYVIFSQGENEEEDDDFRSAGNQEEELKVEPVFMLINSAHADGGAGDFERQKI